MTGKELEAFVWGIVMGAVLTFLIVFSLFAK